MKKLIPVILSLLLLFTYGCGDKKEAKKPTTKKPAVSSDKKAATTTPTSIATTTPTSIPATTTPSAKPAAPSNNKITSTPPASQPAPVDPAAERAAKVAQLNAYMKQEIRTHQWKGDIGSLDGMLTQLNDNQTALISCANQTINKLTESRNQIVALAAPQSLEPYKQYELQILDQYKAAFIKLKNAAWDQRLLDQAANEIRGIKSNSEIQFKSLVTQVAKQSGLDLLVWMEYINMEPDYIFK